jgi:hypothetical protein
MTGPDEARNSATARSSNQTSLLCVLPFWRSSGGADAHTKSEGL